MYWHIIHSFPDVSNTFPGHRLLRGQELRRGRPG